MMRPLCVVYFAICSFAAVASAFMIPQTHRRLHRFGRYLARDAERPFYFAEELDQQSAEEKDKSPIVLPQRATKLPWKFQGHDIYAQVSLPERSSPTKLPAVLLVHGFGCSTYYWRQTIAALTNAGYTVYAIDLLGQGMSAKPYENVTYSINLWAKQLDEFCRENLQPDERVVFIGNSIGSIVSLIAATGDFANETNGCYIKEHIAGIGMFNCGIGMNVRSLTRDPKWSPTQRYLLNAIFDVLESAVFGNVNFLRWILDKVVTRELLRTTLIELYPTAENPEEIVDDELVESIYLPAKEPGSPEVLSQILVNDAGLTPMEVHAKYGEFLDKLPIHLVWGDTDAVTPLDGIGEVGQFYTALAAADGNHVTMEVVNSGHIPFDEVPSVSNGSLLRWLNEEIVQGGRIVG